MSTYRSVPPDCCPLVFKSGKPLLFASTGPVGGAQIFEEWVVKIRQKSGQPVDWHYSGGTAQVLYLGDHEAVVEAARSIPLPSGITILRWCAPMDRGLYRAGVTPTPDDAIAAAWEGGGESTLIRQR